MMNGLLITIFFMAKSAKFTLAFDKKALVWQLRSDATKKVFKTFPSKEAATKAGVLFAAIGKAGGAVKIMRVKGGIVETRHYPSGNDKRYALR